jgi:NitT/TauT family transport system substrate-binding protein
MMDSVTRRAVLKVSAGIGLLAPLSALAATRFAGAQQKDRITIGASPFINQATIFLAVDMGLFDKVGIEIGVRSFPDGAFVVAPLLSGEIDLGVVTSSAGLFNSLSRGATYRSILCLGQGKRGRAVTAIVVRRDHFDAGIRTIKDLAGLKGKLVAVGAIGSINQYGMSTALAMAGLKPSTDVRWQTNVAQPEIIKQFAQKQIDAADITYHLAFLAEQQGLVRIIASRDEVLPDSQTAMIAVREELLKSRRDAVVRFAMACIHAGRIFNKIAGDPSNHPEALQTIIKHIFVKDVNLLKAVAPHWEWIAEDGQPNVKSVLAQQDHWVDHFNLIERRVSADQIFDLTIARDADTRLSKEKPFGP